MNNPKFYNILSSNYDLMINFENSLKNKIENLKKFIEPNYKSALDFGCGTGIDSIALSQLGLKVTSVDHSKEMIKMAMENSIKYNCEIDFIKSDLTKIRFDESFDLIISLGNTLANLSFEELEILFSQLKKLLNETGKIIFKIINYSSIPKGDEYILNRFENEKILIIRKYRFKINVSEFVINLTDKIQNQKQEIVTKIFLHNFNDFIKLANQNNFDLNILGNLDQYNYIENKSKNIV